MAFLLTGGTGYIGSHTAVTMIRAGMDVILADDLSNSKASVVERIEQITGVRPRFYQIDVSDRQALSRIFEENPIEGVIHFAASKAVRESVENPLKYYKNNLGTMISVLEVMKTFGCRVLVFSSSACVYGEDLTPPFSEDMRAGNCINPYGRTKFMCEQIIADASASDPELSAVILRYFNPVGTDESGIIGEESGSLEGLTPYVLAVASGSKPHLNIFGTDYPTPDGTCLRDYIHIKDLAEGHMLALGYAKDHTGTEIFNLGTGRPFSVREYVDAFERATGIAIPVKEAPRRPGDCAVSFADCSKARQILGFTARSTLEEMCASAWNWQKGMEKYI